MPDVALLDTAGASGDSSSTGSSSSTSTSSSSEMRVTLETTSGSFSVTREELEFLLLIVQTSMLLYVAYKEVSR
jgi:hypothetical protein